MNPFEAERLGWEEIRGLPIVPDPELGTGRFRIVCSRDLDGAGIEETEAIGEPIEVGEPVAGPGPESRDNSDREPPPLRARSGRAPAGRWKQDHACVGQVRVRSD